MSHVQELILQKLAELEQNHLNAGLASLSTDQLDLFYRDLLALPKDLLLKMRSYCRPVEQPLFPLRQFDTSGNHSDVLQGQQWLSRRKMGCLILAGGQASRLGGELPKALYPISPIHHKPLLRIFCEKIKAAQTAYGCDLPVAVMTSPLNHAAITVYLQQNNFFGLNAVSCFSQSLLPLLTEQGDWLLLKPGHIAKGPDGNGLALHHFYRSGLWLKWQELGVEALSIIPIDNPLADPFDAELVGYHMRKSAAITLKCILRLSPEEPVGIVGTRGSHLAVQEYSELPQNHSDFKIAHIGLYCISMSLVANIANQEMPWHIARKTIVTERGKETIRKFETFIFDILKHTENSHLLVYPRDRVYAPLKNASGDKSPETVKAAMMAADRLQYKAITGLEPSTQPFELDPSFYYPTQEMLAKWQDKKKS